MSRKVAIFAVPFSPNLGDGVLHLALQQQLQQIGVQDVVGKDLAGRTTFPHQPSRGGARELFIRLSPWLPAVVRRGLMQHLVLQPLLKSQQDDWRETLKEADICWIGGGNLLSDVDLNFPAKIAAVAKLCEETQCPFHFVLVGCGSSWSKPGQRMMQKVFENEYFRSISFRDQTSLEQCEQFFRLAPTKNLGYTADPAITLTQQPARKNGTVSILGLNVSDPVNLRFSGDHSIKASNGKHQKLYCTMIQAAEKKGWKVKLFTNGAWEDEQFLHALIESGVTGSAARLERASDPAQLINSIAMFDALAGFRLHANIVAYAQQVPMLGLEWDSKMRGFVTVIDSPHTCLPIDAIDDAAITTFLERVERQNWINFDHKTKLIAEVKDVLRKQLES